MEACDITCIHMNSTIDKNWDLRRAHIVVADNWRKVTNMEIAKIVAAKRQQKGNKQDSLTGGNDLQRQHDGSKGWMTAAGNGV